MENRARLLLEVVEAVIGVYGAERVGVRLSPLFAMLGMHDSAPETTFYYGGGAQGYTDYPKLDLDVDRRTPVDVHQVAV